MVLGFYAVVGAHGGVGSSACRVGVLILWVWGYRESVGFDFSEQLTSTCNEC